MHCIEDVYVPLFIMVNYFVQILCLFENVYFSKTFSIYYICCRPSVCRHHGFCEITFFSSWLIFLNFYRNGFWHRIKIGIYLRYGSPMISKQEAPRCQKCAFIFFLCTAFFVCVFFGVLFSLNWSCLVPLGVRQHIFSSSYGFWDKIGQEMPFSKIWIFLFLIQY